jgi:transcriptional regulator with XRE-family HTH domain
MPPRSKQAERAGVTPPEDVSGQLCRRVRQLRKERGWSLEALARASGVSRSMLSQIERNQANPTLAVAVRIARAFSLALGDLLGTPGGVPSIEVVRAGDRAYHFRSGPACRIRTLSPLHLEKDVEFYEVRLTRGGALRSAAHFQGTREFLTVQRGRVRVESGADAEELGAGDSASYRADVEHALVNTGRSEALLLLVDIYP